MSENQHFCLKWNHHQHTLVSLFSSLLDTNTFVDCTLAAGGKQIKAHKMIISACSPYFKEILLEHSDTHPIIILNNLQFSELAAIVEFMYRGEVNVSQDQLPTFLKAANTLQIKGLTNDDDEEEEGSEKSTKKTARTESPATPEPLRKMIKTEPVSVGAPVDEESPKDLSINDSYAMSYHSASEDSAHSSIRLKVDTDDDSHPGAYPIPQAFMKQETYIQSPNSNSTIMESAVDCGENSGISTVLPDDTSTESNPVVKQESDLDHHIEDSVKSTACFFASESDPVVKKEGAAFDTCEDSINIRAIQPQQISSEPVGGGGESEDVLSHPNKALRKRKSMCPFCLKWQTNLVRHVMRLHSTQDLVKDLVALKQTDDRKGIRIMEQKIRCLGAKEYNSKKIAEDPLWVPKGIAGKGERLPCEFCSLLLQKSSLKKHLSFCSNRPPDDGSSQGAVKTRKRIQKAREEFINMTGMVMTESVVETLRSQPSKELVKVISHIRDAEMRRFILQDDLLVDYGNTLCHSLATETQDNIVRSKLKTFETLCRVMKELNPSDTIRSVDLINANYFELLTESIKKKAGWDQSLKRYQAPSFVRLSGNYLMGLANHAIGYAVLKKDDELKKQVENWRKCKKARYPLIMGNQWYKS